jgi:hypothetical protein
MTLILGAFEVEHDVSGIHTLTQGRSLGKMSAIGREEPFAAPQHIFRFGQIAGVP